MAKRSSQSQLEKAAEYIDKGFERGDSKLTDRAFTILERLSNRKKMLDEDAVLFHYYRANAHQNRQHEAGLTRSWMWEMEHFQSELLELRKAVRHRGFEKLDHIRQCQVLTNLGGKLSTVGRPVEALHYWDRALSIEPRFAMALLNQGEGLANYAQSVSDVGHRQLMLAQAHDSIVAGLDDSAIHDNPSNLEYLPIFEQRAQALRNYINIASANENLREKHSLGRSKAERSYRQWCLSKRLFLNPMNDLGPHSIASHDSLVLPSITMPIEKGGATPPPVFGLFNQLKQEYASARYLLYEGVTAERTHFSDKGVKLINTLDFPSYTINVEKMRVAFRMAYSLFDKIAYLLNHYLELNIPPNQVYFRSIWYERKGRQPKPLLDIFKDRENWPLRGLFWLSKDFHDKEFKAVTEPAAEALAELRNQLEHKYCQLHEQWGFIVTDVEDARTEDTIGFHIGRDDFAAKALRLLSLARAAIIYLCLAIHREENLKKNSSDDTFIGLMTTDTWDDKWKI